MPCKRRGAAQALVESALVLPLVIMLSLGVLQVVLYTHARDVLTSAVQEGARLAAEDGRGLQEGYARAQALVTAGLGTSVEPVRLEGSLDGESVALKIDANLRPILPLPLVERLPIHAEGRVARERFRPAGGGR
jgi:TadE-like protein